MATATRLPPGKYGMPYVGETFDIFGDPYLYAKRQYERYGPIFKTRNTNMLTIGLLSAEANRYVLATNYRNFLWHDGYRTAYPLFGDALITTDGDLHDSQRKLMSPAFHARNMPGYLERMERVIGAQLDHWGTSGTRYFYPDARKIAFTLACSLLVGIETGDDYERLNQLWGTFANGLFTVFRMPGPMTRYGRALQANRQLERLLRAYIADKRQNPTSDALGLLINARDEDGTMLSDEQLIAQIKILVFAGYDTTASTVAWTLGELLYHPECLERVRAEVRADAKDEPLTFEDLRQKPYLDAVIKEALRLHPQAFAVLRGVKEDFEYEGFAIPAGWTVMLMPVFTQRMDEYFAEPERFDPERFLPPREEDAKHPYAFLGFGGGPRICLGEGIARLEIKALLTKLLRHYDVKLVPDQDFTPAYIPLSRPKGNLHITYAAR